MRTHISILLIFSISFSFWNCDDVPTNISCPNGVFATVKDLTGLDGCGFVFELADGTRLEPIRPQIFMCIPSSKEITEDPLYNFQFVEGKQVRIGYEEIQDVVSVCMVGKIAKITCLEEIKLLE